MVRAQQPLPRRENLPYQRDRVGDPACRMVCLGEAVSRAQGVRMVGSQTRSRGAISGSPIAMACGMLSPSSTR